MGLVYFLLGMGLFLAVNVSVFSVRLYVVSEHERALLYRLGRFRRLLNPGSHWLFRPWHSAQKIDMRARFVTMAGQELLTADNIGIKISLVASFRVEDPYRAINETENFYEALYLLLQLQLRDLIGALAVDDLLTKRQEIGTRLHEHTAPQAAEIGLTLLTVGIKDIMFPGDLKQMFAQIVNARKEGLAALERARGESAALRNLANSAHLLDKNPALLQLRLLQALSSGSGNTVVLVPSLDKSWLPAAAAEPAPSTATDSPVPDDAANLGMKTK
jgi:regulator of protease activity HflC (stomatin/prohibitin superfamily)